MEPGAPATDHGAMGLRGLDHLSEDLYRRWVKVAVAVTWVGYAVVTVSDFLLFGFGTRHLALLTQSITLVSLSVALILSWRGHTESAAILTLAAVWVELQASIPFTGMQTSGLIAYPVLVSAAGILLGGRAGYLIAGCTTLSLAVMAWLHAVFHPADSASPMMAAYLLVVTTASMFAAAALVQLGLDSLARVLLAAHHSERRLTDLLANAPDGIVATDAEGRIVSLNPVAEELLGRERRQRLAGADLRSVLEPRLLPGGTDDPLAPLLTPSGEARSVTLAFQGAGDETLWVEAQAGPVEWADGHVGCQLTLRDVTERRRAEENQKELRARLEHAQRLEAVGRLAGGVAHEFNNLLTIVGSSAELLLASTKGPDRALATDILEAKVRGAALTKQLLAFARKDLIQPRRISLTELARDMEVLLGRFLTEKVRFTLDADQPTQPVVADRAQVEQIIVNLVINAKDAVRGKGHVTLGVYPGGAPRRWRHHAWTVDRAFVELSVIDDGHGMDPLTLDRAFEPFFSTKPRGKGTGLGLATVHGTVVQNGGRVRILTEPDHGTAVIVTWPVATSGT